MLPGSRTRRSESTRPGPLVTWLAGVGVAALGVVGPAQAPTPPISLPHPSIGRFNHAARPTWVVPRTP